MSLSTKTTKQTNSVNAPCLSSNHKVIHYLQNSTRCSSTTAGNTDVLLALHKTTSSTQDIFNEKDLSINSNSHNPSQHRIRSCSDNGSSSSAIDTLSRSDFSLGSSLSDPGGHFSILSSNTSSSGICSTSSDPGHEEGTSTSSEDLDFNLGFDQISENDDDEIANLNEIDQDIECEQNYAENQPITNKYTGDTATLLGAKDANLDERISELEEFLRKSYDSTCIDDDFDNDDTITADRTKQKSRATFLHDSTYTLCSQDRFSAYTESDDSENDEIATGIGIRSNSLGIVPVDRNTAILDKAPKKVVRFADMFGLDLESIRYMTPPDQSTNSLIQECIRIKLEQLRFTKAQSSLSSTPLSSPFDLSSHNRSSSTEPTKQYNLVSKYFTSPSDIPARIYNQKIILECLYTKDSIAYGTVRVHNFAYDKRVFARITDDDWQTYQDIQAWHSLNYPNDNTDTFTFEIRLKKYANNARVPKQIYFVVCLQAMCQEFWDNNRGWNYMLDVLERR